ncbi:hypothetical protein MBLNU230_g8614t1 [Neophaeotheca triangularis]
MRYDTSKITLGLRIAQAIFAIIVLGLTAYVASWWSSYWNSTAPAQISFLLFTSIWTLLVLIYLFIIPNRFSTSVLANPYLILGLEALTMLFWFAGFIAVAVFLGDRVCFGHVCAAGRAAAVFGGFTWLLFAVTTALAALAMFRGGARGNTTSPTTRGSTPKPDGNVNIHEGA